MNVLLLANHFNTGGIATYILQLSKGLTSRGHTVWVASSGGNCVDLLSAGVRHKTFNIRVKLEVHPQVLWAAPRLARFVKAEGIQILHANTRVTQVLSCWAQKMTGVPFVSTCHGFFKPRLFRRMFPCWGEEVIAISQSVKEHLIKDFHVDESQVSLIPNGIDVGQFAFVDDNQRARRRDQWRAQGGPIVGIVARLSSVKGIDLLVRIFPRIRKEFPQAQLWIVGDGPEKENLQRLAKRGGLGECVRFESVVNRTAEILPVFDVFVLPSIQEGLGLSVMEAQACGIPVVASAVGGLPDLVEEGKTGLLFVSGQAEALVDKILQVLKDPAQAQAMAGAARRQIENKFSLDKMVEQTVHLYNSIDHAQNFGR